MSVLKMFFVVAAFIALASLFYFLGKYRQYTAGFAGVSLEINGPGVNMVLKNIRLVEKKGNRMVTDLLASKAVINNELNRIELDNINAVLYDPEYASFDISSDTGLLNSQTKDFDLKGNVKVFSEDGVSLITDNLKWIEAEKVFHTNDFVTIKGKNFRLTGIGMESGIDPKKLKLNKGVHAIFYQ